MLGDSVKTIILEPWEHEWAIHVGTRREEINRGKQDAAYYDASRMENNLVANIASCCGEMAVAKHLNLYWGGDAWPLSRHEEMRDRPDLEPSIEVRRVREIGNPMAVRQRDVERDRTMWCVYVHPENTANVTLVGMLPAAWAWKYGEQPSWDKTGTTRVVAQGLLMTDGVPNVLSR
jgi:hypothetical protein